MRLLVGVPEKAEQRTRGGAVYFRVADIQAVHATLTAAKVPFAGAPQLVHKGPTADLWLAEFRDPDGNMLVLMSEVARG